MRSNVRGSAWSWFAIVACTMAALASPGSLAKEPGQPAWECFQRDGEKMLDHPSRARELPETGDIIVADALRDRVIVIDRNTREFIWQYGVTDKKGHAPGYLNYRDGFDLDLYRDWEGVAAGR
jgi:hypothetical protein